MPEEKKEIEFEEKKKPGKAGAEKEEPLEVDIDKVEKIVKRMRSKYREEGVEFEEVGGSLRELRGLVAEGISAKVEIQTVDELLEVKNKLIKFLAGTYVGLGAILKPVAKTLSRLPEMEMLSFYLYSADMHYSSKQYLAITVASGTIAFVAALMVSIAALTYLKMQLVAMIAAILVISFMSFLITAVIILMVPKQKAVARGTAVSIELPFALRHMATELRAGIGLYRTVQAIAIADYGVLSEEFARVITEVEEGTDAKDALRHLALRTQSKALRNSLVHIVRALKTGGNLSESINQIAEDVSFELRMAVSEFSQRMNFFGVIFIFGAIVMPVMIAILGSIRNSPLKETMRSFQALPLSIPIMIAIYLVVMPIIMVLFIVYIKSSQPKV